MYSPTMTYTFDSKRISKTLLDLAEENFNCPENRRYISIQGLVKLKSKVSTFYKDA